MVIKIMDIKNIESKFKKIGVNIKHLNGGYKSWYDIFEEIAKIWHENNLNDEENNKIFGLALMVVMIKIPPKYIYRIKKWSQYETKRF